MNATPEKLMTVDELARRLDIGHEKVRELVRDRRIPHLRIDKALRFQWAEVCDALRASTPACGRQESQP